MRLLLFIYNIGGRSVEDVILIDEEILRGEVGELLGVVESCTDAVILLLLTLSKDRLVQLRESSLHNRILYRKASAFLAEDINIIIIDINEDISRSCRGPITNSVFHGHKGKEKKRNMQIYF